MKRPIRGEIYACTLQTTPRTQTLVFRAAGDPAAVMSSIRRALQSTAKDLGPRGRDNDFGWGLVDPYLAMLALDNPALANARPPTPVPQQ